ncbi:helix-turn-helix transcriptional regulator [Sulfitobacter sp. S190]|nr:helix-turn-helix transcriptional regulator [Sulfitobacter sp. S190]
MRVFGPQLRNAAVCLGPGPAGGAPDAQTLFGWHAGMQLAHMRLCALSEQAHPAISHLSPREMEILRWIARGKSTPVIADILGISRHTVDTVMRRLFDKLEVNDRTAAAIEGLRRGHLLLDGTEVV